MNKYSEELQAEILQDEGIQYDESLKDEMFDYIFFENIREQLQQFQVVDEGQCYLIKVALTFVN